MRKIMLIVLLCRINVAEAQTQSLQYFIDQALTNSPLIKDLQNQAKLNSLDSMLILAVQKPQVSFTSNELYAPVIRGWGYDNAITNGANVSALVGVSKNLLNGPSNKAAFANIQLLIRSVRTNAEVTMQDIRKVIIEQYIITYGDMLQLNSGKILGDMMTKQDKILKILTQKNVYKQVDYLAFAITIQQNDFKLKQLNNQYAIDYSLLNYLAGTTDTVQHLLEQPELDPRQPMQEMQSVFFQKFYIDSLSLANNKKIIDMTYRPRLNVFADAGYNSSLAIKPYKNIGASAGVSLIVPIYDGKQKKLQYDKIALQEDTRKTNKEFYSRQYTQQLAQLRQQLNAVSGLKADLNKQLRYIETLIVANEKLLQTGEVRVYDYILSLTNLLNARSAINSYTISQLQIINQINYWSK